MERLDKERQERHEAYEREKREKEEKHRKALEDIKQRGKQLLMQDAPGQKKPIINIRAEEENRPLARRPESGGFGAAQQQQ